jgi:hypothetical protein
MSKGWIFCKDLIVNSSMILCDDEQYHKVQFIEEIGYHKIVDITV